MIRSGQLFARKATETHTAMFEKCATARYLLCCYVKICQLFSKLSRGIFQCEESADRETVKVGELV